MSERKLDKEKLGDKLGLSQARFKNRTFMSTT
jgi:hypothetical protein